jgi:bifunctional non-homologous end joining protein LigD
MDAADDSEVWQVGERSLEVSHLTKLYWPEAGVTKGDLLRYYAAIAPVAMPHFRRRPVTMRVYPDGVRGLSFYQRDRPTHAPAWLGSVDYRPKTAAAASDVAHLPVVDDAAGLVWLANVGTIEFHLWTARLPDLARPDQAVFDLDPGPAATFADVCQAALRLRAALVGDGVLGYAKTSGGRGLHVYVPLMTGSSFEQVRAWVKAVAERLAAAGPDLIAVAHGPTHRGAKVTIDHAQNSVGRNTAAPYTVRARRPGPVVSTPLEWEEIEAGGVDPGALTPQVVLERAQRRGDLFAPVARGGQRPPGCRHSCHPPPCRPGRTQSDRLPAMMCCAPHEWPAAPAPPTPPRSSRPPGGGRPGCARRAGSARRSPAPGPSCRRCAAGCA